MLKHSTGTRHREHLELGSQGSGFRKVQTFFVQRSKQWGWKGGREGGGCEVSSRRQMFRLLTPLVPAFTGVGQTVSQDICTSHASVNRVWDDNEWIVLAASQPPDTPSIWPRIWTQKSQRLPRKAGTWRVVLKHVHQTLILLHYLLEDLSVASNSQIKMNCMQ